jgi:hypothetical protein
MLAWLIDYRLPICLTLAALFVLARLSWNNRAKLREWFSRKSDPFIAQPTIEQDLHTALGLLARAKRRDGGSHATVTTGHLAQAVESLVREMTA